MKKRFLTFFCAALSAATMTTGVYADTESSTAPDLEEIRKVMEVAESKNKAETITYTNEEGGESEYQVDRADIDDNDVIKIYDVPFITVNHSQVSRHKKAQFFRGSGYFVCSQYKASASLGVSILSVPCGLFVL